MKIGRYAMQAVLSKINNNVKDEIKNLEVLLKSLENADNNTKNDIENSIVSFGAKAVDFLVEKLSELEGMARGVVAMSLIRIGEPAIIPLKEQALECEDFQWIANYLISEIKGTY